MEHVIVQWKPDQGGYWLDPTAYQAMLPSLARSLPAGARDFALDPQHYDFYGDRCVKDLWFRSLTLDDARGSASLSFAPNSSKHVTGLTLLYSGLVSIAVERERDPTIGWFGSLLLDELRPSPEGLAHEFALTGGSILVAAQDVEAAWG
jgi:hypothetical protein